MTEPEEERLPARAEALLHDWPMADSDEQAWEERAQRISARLDGVAIGSTPDALLEAPLPEEPARAADSGPAPTAASEVEEPSFAEMARAVVKKKAEDANALARESLQVASAARRSAPEIVERVRRASVPPAASEQEAVPAREVSTERRSRPAPPNHRVNWMPAVIGAVALAAAVALWVRMRPATPGAAPLLTTTAAPATATAAVPEAHAGPVPPNAEPRAESEVALAPAGKAAPSAPAKSRPAAVAPPPAAAAAAATANKAGAVVLEEQTPPTQAAPPSSAPLRPADGTGTQVPDAPSSGAIQAALARPKVSAGHCVVGMPGETTATVVFGSDGKVHSVSVAGPAQGTAAEACIQSALSQAKVQPFARDTFQVRIPIRP